MKTQKEKQVYVIVDKKGNPNLFTIHYQRQDCISGFLTENTTWKEAQKHGWKCEKVNLLLTSVNQ